MSEDPYPFVDLALARRLERTEARSNANFVEAKAKLFPDSGARWIEVAGAYAMFDGIDSPMTQTFGLGLFDPITSTQMEEIESFFQQRGAPVLHEISPLADVSLLPLLNERGYQPFEYTSVMFRPAKSGTRLATTRNERLHARPVRTGNRSCGPRLRSKDGVHPRISATSCARSGKSARGPRDPIRSSSKWRESQLRRAA